MVKYIKITSIFFLSLFMWQLIILFASPLINSQPNSTKNSISVSDEMSQTLEFTADYDVLDNPSNQLIEEVLEEEIELTGSSYFFTSFEVLDFHSYYCAKAYHSVLTSDYIPPETTI